LLGADSGDSARAGFAMVTKLKISGKFDKIPGDKC
jgi:hypothetical protein